MKIKNRYLYNFSFVLFVAFFLMSAAAVTGEELLIPVGEWPPYIESGRKDMGIMSEIVVRSFANPIHTRTATADKVYDRKAHLFTWCTSCLFKNE